MHLTMAKERLAAWWYLGRNQMSHPELVSLPFRRDFLFRVSFVIPVSVFDSTQQVFIKHLSHANTNRGSRSEKAYDPSLPLWNL